MKNSWTVTVEEDPETKDLILPLSADMLNQMGWDFGDTIVWEDLGNGSFSLSKKTDDVNKEAPTSVINKQ